MNKQTEKWVYIEDGDEELKENLTLEEQRINSMLYESVDLSKYPGISPTSAPPEFEEDCITLEEFEAHGIMLIEQQLKEWYGISD